MRVSTTEQEDRGTIHNQRAFAENYCKLHEVGIAGWYVDDGVSGAVPLDQRPEGRRLLQDAAEKRFNTILVYRIDRLGRSLLGLLKAMEALEVAGVAVKSMTEPFDTGSAIGRFVMQILGVIAELERATISERTTQGHSRVAREGRWNGGTPPLGYRVEEGRLAIHEEEAALVRRIFRPLYP